MGRQKLSIGAVPDGRYALRSVADPDNNGAIAYLQRDGDEVEEVDESSPARHRAAGIPTRAGTDGRSL